SGRFDFGLSASGAKDDVNMVVALGLPKAESLTNLIDLLATDENVKKEVEFNVADHRGVKMHRLRKSDGNEPTSVLKHFGAVFGLSSDAMYFSAGNGDGLAPLKTAVETVQAVSPTGAAPLAELRVFAGRIDKLKSLDLKGEAQAAFAKHF